MRKIIVIVLLILFLIAGCVQQPIVPQETTTVEEPEEIQKEQEETEEKCTTGWKCLDKNRKGYQFSNCVFTQVNVCTDGCKDGECITGAPPEEEKEETFSLTQGRAALNKLGWKSCDFSEQQIFEDGVTEQDFKIKLYARPLGYNYLKVESPGPNIWIIEKEINKATREDCMGRIVDVSAYNYLRTGQTVCIQTKEKNIALVGGYWDGVPEEDTKLSWKYYIPE